jgi:hypothetical protein
MIKLSTATLSFALLVFISSCKEEECHDVDYGYQDYDPISLTYEKWDSVTAAIFIDSNGTEHRYELSIDVEYQGEPLHPDTCEGELVFTTHSYPYYLRRFSVDSNTAIAFAQFVDYLDGETSYKKENLVDILKLTVYDDNMPPVYVSRICIITSNRGGAIDQETYNAAQFIVRDSIVLLNKTFYNVYEQKVGTKKLYYSPDIGVVSFTDNAGTKLVLDRIE